MATTSAQPRAAGLALVPRPVTPGSDPGTAEPQRPARWLSIRWIVVVTAAGLLTAAVLAVGAVSERNTREALTREIETRLFLQAGNLAMAGSEALLSDFPELTLHPLAREMKSLQPELALVEVLDHDRIIQGDPDPRRLGTRYVPGRTLRPIVSHQPQRGGEQLLTDGTLLVASVPVMHRDGRRIGTAMAGIRRDYLEGVLDRVRQQQMIVLEIVLLVGIATAALLMSFLMRPVAALRKGIERIGRGDLSTPVRLRNLTELGLLGDAIDHMAVRLRGAQAELVQRERLAHELELAHRIQSSLLPAKPLRHGPFEVRGSHRAAEEVGGDFYDHFLLPDGRVGVAIADVSGKGLAGCMVMSMLSAMVRAYRDLEFSPSALLTTLDARLGETLELGSFVTMFYGVLDPQRCELTYASAGHSPLLVYRHDDARVESFRSKGIPLGAVRGGAIRATLRDETVRLAPGDVLVQFTDGVNEAFDPSGREQFGFERLEAVVRESAPRGADAVLGDVHRAVEAWVNGGPAGDDESMLVIARVPARAAAPPVAGAGCKDPSASLAAARAAGRCIEVHADDLVMSGLREWLDACPGVADQAGPLVEIIHAVLHELGINIGEHGYRGDPSRTFEVWHVPARASGLAPDGPEGSLQFLLRDSGQPFDAVRWRATDFSDRGAWRRGRGFGLDIIHRGAQTLTYHPRTPEGNITLVAFDHDSARSAQKEPRHA